MWQPEQRTDISGIPPAKNRRAGSPFSPLYPTSPTRLARIMHEAPSRDRGDGRATGQPQGLGPEAYLSVRRKVRDPRTPGRTAISAVAAGGSCIMRARPASAPPALPLRSAARALDNKPWRRLGRRVTRRGEKSLAPVDPSRYNPFRLDATNRRLTPEAIRGTTYAQEVF